MPFLALPGAMEIWVILGVLILIFGARKLPELARAMGSSITMFKKGLKEDPEQLSESSTDEKKEEA